MSHTFTTNRKYKKTIHPIKSLRRIPLHKKAPVIAFIITIIILGIVLILL